MEEVEKKIAAAHAEIVALKAHMLDLKMGFEENEKLLAVKMNNLQLLQGLRISKAPEEV